MTRAPSPKWDEIDLLSQASRPSLRLLTLRAQVTIILSPSLRYGQCRVPECTSSPATLQRCGNLIVYFTRGQKARLQTSDGLVISLKIRPFISPRIDFQVAPEQRQIFSLRKQFHPLFEFGWDRPKDHCSRLQAPYINTQLLAECSRRSSARQNTCLAQCFAGCTTRIRVTA